MGRSGWLGVVIFAAACGGPTSSGGVTGAGATAAAAPAPVPVSEAEQHARARWFPFELAAVDREHGGDWAAFVAAKQAREDALDAAWQDEARRYGEFFPLRSAEDVRAVRVLFEEWEQVATADRDAVVAEARRVLALLQAGALDELARDCVHYSADAPDRVELCAAMLRERGAELAAAVRGIDPASLEPDALEFSSPEPEAGMTGQVVIPFGTPAPAPSDPDLYPSTWQIELWWSGQVMPEANGPRHARPLAPDQPAGRWRFYDLVAPYSRAPVMRI